MKITATKQITQKTLLFALTAILLLSAIAQVSAQGNTTAINITEFSFTPSTIDTTDSSQPITFTIRVTDSERDVTSISMNFRSPLGNQIVYVDLNSSNRISGNARDGVYSKAAVFPQYSGAGMWRVNYVYVSDGLNFRGFFGSQLAALGFTTQFQIISNNQDVIPPQISNFSFTPTVIDTTKGSQNVTVTFRATDATSGVRYIYLNFYTEDLYCDYYNGDFCGFDVGLDSTNRISGDDKDGVYRAVFTVPQNTPLGIYDAYVTAQDAVSLYRGLSSDDLAALGYPSQLRITGGTPFDFDGDGRSDISVFRPSDGFWHLNQSTNGFYATQFGLSSDRIAPADFDGDGKTDIAVYRDGIWYWLNSSNNNFNAIQFGLAGDIPQSADFTGDGRAELAVYRGGTWWLLDLTNQQVSTIQFGLVADKPIVADYDGDGRADQAVYRGDGEWHLNRSSQGYTVVNFGLATDKLVPADYDGDGKTDQAVYREGTWYLLGSQSGFTAFQFGLASDIPAPADYDGDGRADAAVYRDGTWYLRQSTNGISAVQFGLANDKPVPSAYLP